MIKHSKYASVYTFDSSYTYLDYLENAPTHIDWKGRSLHALAETTGDWDGTRNFPDAIRMGKFGWKQGAERINSRLKLLKPLGRGESWTNDVAGAFPNVPAYLAGIPTCMRAKKKTEESRKPIVELTIQVMYSAPNGAESIMNMGAAIVEAVDSLENMGFICNIKYMNLSTAVDNTICGSIFNMKDAGQALDIDRLIFWIANPAAIRRLDFRFFETTMSGKELDYAGHYGRVPPRGDARVRELAGGEETVFFETHMSDNCYSMASARLEILDQFQKQRPDLFEVLTKSAA